MKISGVDHIAVAVKDTAKALRLWRDGFGFAVKCSEIVNDGSVKLTHLDGGGVDIQLVEPLSDDHPTREWLVKNGEGLHHICLAASFDDDPIDDVKKAGLLPAQKRPHEGVQGKRALFLSTEVTGKIRVELTGY